MPERWCKVDYSDIHGRGVFARSDIPEGTWIVQYKGEKITKAESQRRALERDRKGKKNGSARVYIFSLNSRYDLDGNLPGNIARFINHGCETNCEAVSHHGAIWIVATTDIKEGEELLFNYGYGFEHFLEHPCHCGSAQCVGYIVAESDRPKLRKILVQMERKKEAMSQLKQA